MFFASLAGVSSSLGIPQATIAPQVTGTSAPGDTLTATRATWTGQPDSYSGQWYRDGVAIEGETGLTYECTEDDVLASLRYGETATNALGTSSESLSAIVVGHLRGDYYVSPDGSDEADGTSRATAWATFAKLNEYLAAATEDTAVVITAGTYTGEGVIVDENSRAITFTFEFEPGVIVDTSGNAEAMAGLQVSDTTNAVVARLRGAEFTGNNSNSANGIGVSGAVTLTVYGRHSSADTGGTKAHFHGYDDGFSCHFNPGTIAVYDCRFSDCNKSAFAHVQTSYAHHERCQFEGKSGATLGIGQDQSTGTKSTFVDCDFIPAAAGQSFRAYDCTGCRFGTLTLRVQFGWLADTGAVWTDCFLNMNGDGPNGWTMNRCYGFYDFRIRGIAEPALESVFTNCIFYSRGGVDFADGSFDADGINWLGGSASFVDCIIKGYGKAFDWQTNAQRDHMNANWTVDHCCLHGNTANFDDGLTLGTNLLTSDPLIGDRSTMDQSSWGYGEGSPCIGAGADGGNIGFAAN